MLRDRLPSVSRLTDDAPAVKTWRYLRVAMVVLVAGLSISIAYELGRRGFDCVQTSISAYYYTAVQAFFVAALVSIGACMVCLKGNTDAEDILLNLAGMFAPVVAFVPTAGADHCATILEHAADREALATNNVTTLLALGIVGLVVLAILGGKRGFTPPERTGFLVAAATVAIALGIFLGDRPYFLDNAHFTAAVLMFTCIFLVVLVNAVNFRPSDRLRRNRYKAVAIAMGVSCLAVGAAALAGWDYSILAIEAALIFLFATFWVVQSRELWEQGLRTPTDARAAIGRVAPRRRRKRADGRVGLARRARAGARGRSPAPGGRRRAACPRRGGGSRSAPACPGGPRRTASRAPSSPSRFQKPSSPSGASR